MAQQQFLMLVLAAMVIGVAILIGMDRLAQESDAAMREEVHRTVATLAAQAQVWYHAPAALGGGGKSFEAFTLDKVHFKTGTLPGTVTVSQQQPDRFRLTGTAYGDSTWSLSVDVYPDSFAVAQ